MTRLFLQETAESGESVFIYQHENGRKVALNSLVSPDKEAEKFLKPFLGEKKIYFLIGMGNGAIVKKWLEFGDFIHLFIIEPYDEIEIDEELRRKLEEHPKVSLQYYSELTDTTESFRSVLETFLGLDMQIVVHPNYDKTDTSYLKEITAKLIDSTKLIRINQNTEYLFQKEWVIEPLSNLEYLFNLTSLDHLKDCFKGEKAVLVASGPSLKENIEHVRNMQKSAYIFAAGSAVNGLLHHGITPDFVTSFDSSIRNYEAHFKDSTYQGPLIVGSIVNSNILKNHKGTAVYCVESIDHITKRVNKDAVEFTVVPSVAVFTLQVIYYLGFREVYLVGQDLALVNGQYYAQGVNNHAGSMNEKATMYVESNSGEKVGTTHALYAFLESFVSVIKSMDKSRITVYNLSKHGAKIEGAEYIPAESLNFSTERKKIDLRLNRAESSIEGVFAANKVIEELHQLLEEIKDVVRKLNYVSNDYVTVADLKRVSKLFARVTKHSIFEEVVIHQFSFMMQQINNLFAYRLDKEEYTSEDLLTMVKEIKKMLSVMHRYLEDLLQEERIKEIQQKAASANLL